MDEERLPPVDAERQQSAVAAARPSAVAAQPSAVGAQRGAVAAGQRAEVVGAAMSPSAQRELERARRAEAARIAALVQYMLHARADEAST